jgi:flagellar biogenesis protein FliO
MGAVLDSASSGIPAALQALAALALVAGMWWLLKHGPMLRPGARGTNLQVEERIALDGQSALLIVRVDARRLLLATSKGAAARLVCELAQQSPPRSAAAHVAVSAPAQSPGQPHVQPSAESA